MRGYLPKNKATVVYWPQFNYKNLRSLLKLFFRKKRRSTSKLAANNYTHILFSYLGSFIGIGSLAYLSVATNSPLIMAPFGATSVLAFGIPDSPLAQPRNIIGGNLIAATSSLVFLHLFGTGPWVMAIAVATAIGLMQLTKTLHPPAGAVALVAVMTHASWNFIFTPVLIGSILLIVCTVVFNNMVPGRTYPKKWL